MNENIFKLADLFYALATQSESLPKNSDNLDVILKNLDKLENYNSKIEYAEKNLERLSSGSSRIVFLTKKDTVIKLAKNDKGIAQNEAECQADKKSKFLNKILRCSKQFSWLEVPFLEKINEKEFKEMTGIDFRDFGKSIRYGLKSVTEASSISKPKNFDKVCKTEIYKEMCDLGKKYDLMPGDLARISSWGTKNKVPVLIDAGLNKEVFDEYYKSSSGSSSGSSSSSSYSETGT